MKLSKTMMASLAFALGLGVTQSYATFDNGVDFQSDTAGSNPLNADYIAETNAANVFVGVVDSASTPADPFGGVGNKSLWLQDDSPTPSAFAGFRRTVPLPDGKFTMRFYMTQDASFPSPYMSLVLFDDGADTLDGSPQAGEYGPWLDFNAGSLSSPIAIRAFTSGPTLTLDQTVSSNTVHTLELKFNTYTDTYTGLLDGSPLTANSGATTTFSFYNSQAGLDAIGINAGYSTRAGVRMFVDDLVLIPEPTTAALVALGALVIARRRRIV